MALLFRKQKNPFEAIKMNGEIRYIDRLTKKEETEQVYGESFLRFLYDSKGVSEALARFLLPDPQTYL